MPDRVFTTLDCHDGIPVRPDLDGILAPTEMLAIATLVEQRGGNVSRILSSTHAAAGSTSISSTARTSRRSAATTTDTLRRARSSCLPEASRRCTTSGLLAGANDVAARELTGEGRAINRHDYLPDEIEQELERPVVQRLLELVRLRNTHPAFDGALDVELTGRSQLRMCWRGEVSACSLDVDLSSGRVVVDDGLSVDSSTTPLR